MAARATPIPGEQVDRNRLVERLDAGYETLHSALSPQRSDRGI
jgi:hypothetical protein